MIKYAHSMVVIEYNIKGISNVKLRSYIYKIIQYMNKNSKQVNFYTLYILTFMILFILIKINILVVTEK